MDRAELLLLFLEYGRRQMKTRYALLSDLFNQAWERETASPASQEAWTPENPAVGQCAATALCIQDLYGGDIVRTVVAGYGSHYFNRLVNGEGATDYDLTRQQFASGTAIPPGAVVNRSLILEGPRAADARTAERYQRLRRRIVDIMSR